MYHVCALVCGSQPTPKCDAICVQELVSCMCPAPMSMVILASTTLVAFPFKYNSFSKKHTTVQVHVHRLHVVPFNDRTLARGSN